MYIKYVVCGTVLHTIRKVTRLPQGLLPLDFPSDYLKISLVTAIDFPSGSLEKLIKCQLPLSFPSEYLWTIQLKTTFGYS